MSKISQKKNTSCMQVIKTLQTLLKGNYTMSQLVDAMNAKEKDSVFNNSVISKYINTCRYCGIQIPKINGIYYIVKMPFGFELNETETKLMDYFQSKIVSKLNNNHYKNIITFIDKISKFSGKNLVRVEKDSYQLSFEVFERSVANLKKVKLIFKNQDEIIATPLKILQSNQKTYFHILYKEKERMIDVKRLSGIQMTNDKFIAQFKPQVIIFKLKGGLAKRYEAREHEEVKQTTEDFIIVENKGEPKDALIARLMRYDDKCEIIEPDFMREEIVTKIKTALKNYGEI